MLRDILTVEFRPWLNTTGFILIDELVKLPENGIFAKLAVFSKRSLM